MAPKRLTQSELDPVSGEVNWPTVFMDDRYAKLRDSLDHLFSQRQASSGSPADYRAISDEIEALGPSWPRTSRTTIPRSMSKPASSSTVCNTKPAF